MRVSLPISYLGAEVFFFCTFLSHKDLTLPPDTTSLISLTGTESLWTHSHSGYSHTRRVKHWSEFTQQNTAATFSPAPDRPQALLGALR